MKLYMHPVSTASRPVRLLIAENKLDVEEQLVDIMKGEHHADWYAALNPSKLVPTLQDGDLVMTESSAILKYLASSFDLPSYPKDLKQRAKVDEMMDWFNTQFYRDFGYGLAYPQLFPHHKRPTDEHQSGTIAWGKERAETWFGVLDSHYIGSRAYTCGDQITIADYLGSSFVVLGELLRCDLSHFKNVSRWLGNMKKLDSWNRIYEPTAGLANMLKDHQFIAIAP